MTMTSPSNMLWDLLQAQPHDEESIMQCLYDHPDCCSLVIDDKLAIYVAIEQCVSMDIIKQMLICYPACCSRRYCFGRLLLHDLLCHEKHMISSNVVKLIIDGNIESIVAVVEDGSLPLHLECKHHCRYDVVRMIHDICYDAIGIADRGGCYPLHCALSNLSCSSEVVSYLISNCPDVVRRKDSRSRCPLHIECKHHCRYDVIRKLVDIYPDAVNIIDTDDSYPLHHAIFSDYSSAEVISFLISVYPDAVHSPISNGDFPLHMECYYHCRYDVVIKLLDIDPEAISTFNIYTLELPLNVVLSGRRPSIQVIQLLIDRYPESLEMEDRGLLPVYHIFNMYHDLYVSSYASYKISMQYRALIASMIDIHPTSVDEHHITQYMNSSYNQDKPSAYRLLLLLLYDRIWFCGRSMYHHVRDMHVHYEHYRDMNKQFRSPLLYLILRLTSSLSASQQLSHDIIHFHYTCMLDATLCKVLIYTMSAAGRWRIEQSSDDQEEDRCDGDGITYGWMKGDDLGCMLLRKVVLYL